MCPHTTICVLILPYVCPHASIMCPDSPIMLYVSSYFCMCPHTPMCPHTTILCPDTTIIICPHTPIYVLILLLCVLILLYVSAYS